MADDKLVFMAETDNWPHLYAVDVKGGDGETADAGSLHGGERGDEPGPHCACLQREHRAARQGMTIDGIFFA